MSTMIHVRVDEGLKDQAAETLELMGLSLSDAVRVFLKRIVAEKGLPFDLRVPTQVTRAAMTEADEIAARRGSRFADAEDMFGELGDAAKR